MAIANSYFNNSPITDSDIFVGTKYATNRTVNYTAQSIADYLNVNARISISGQLTFKFTILPNVAKTIAFENGGGDGRLFSSIDKLIVSILDAGGSNVTVFLDYLKDSEILLAEQNQPNSFGHYKVTDYVITANTNFYELSLEYIGGNGNIYKDVYYDITPWASSGASGIPNLQQVTDEGAITTNTITVTDTVAGKRTELRDLGVILYDEDLYPGEESAAFLVGQLYLRDMKGQPQTNIALVVDSENPYNINMQFNRNNKRVSLTLPTTLNANDTGLLLPSKPTSGFYTLATLDDIPSLTGYVQTSRTLTINSISYDLSSNRSWSVGDLLSSGSYANPSWITSLAYSKLTGTPTIPTVGTWGTLNYPTWVSGTPFVKMTAAGTFALDTNTYLTTAVTSVDLSMPSAFIVSNNPVTTSGTLTVIGAGLVSQYIRGDGSLANFPTSSGGGSSLSFYLNGSVSQGTFGGVAFKEMDRTPILGAGTDFTINANGYIQSFITDAGVPNQLEIPAGNWNFETYFSASSGGGSPSFYVELYKWDGTTLTLIASNSANPEGITNGTVTDLYVSALAVPQTALLATDRLAVRIYVTHSGRTIKLHTEDNHLCQVITTFSTGLTALNGLAAQVQNFAVDTTGTDFAISSTGTTHTFNLPTASATNRGALSSADWTTFNNKQTDLFEFNTKQGFYFFEDFLGNPANSNTNTMGISTSASGVGAVCIPNTTYPNRTNQQGVMQMGTGTTAIGASAIRLGDNNSTTHYLGNGVYTMQFFINIETLSTLSERFYLIIGSTTTGNFANTNGIFFIYDEGVGTYGAASPNFKCVTRSALIGTTTITSVPVVASQWYVLKIVINANATSVEFFIDGVSVATHTTNIPTLITPRVTMQKTIGLTNRNAFCDYFLVKQTYTTPRT